MAPKKRDSEPDLDAVESSEQEEEKVPEQAAPEEEEEDDRNKKVRRRIRLFLNMSGIVTPQSAEEFHA